MSPTTGMPFLRIDRWKPSRLTDGSPCVAPEDYEPVFRDNGDIELLRDGRLFARRPAESLYFDVCAAPLAQAETPADLDAEAWHAAMDAKYFSYIHPIDVGRRCPCSSRRT